MINKIITRNNLIIFNLGIASAIPLILIMSSLGVWFYELGVSMTAIGLFALVSSPYSLKFLWSPLLDGLKIPILNKYLGKRKSWMFVLQISLFVMIMILAFHNHKDHLFITAIIALIIAFLSASQDILIDAYRIELGSENEQGILVTSYVYGYRIGMLIAGAGVLVVAEFYNFVIAYVLCATLFLLFALLNFFLPKEIEVKKETPKNIEDWFVEYVVQPFTDFFSKDNALMILLFIVLFKLGDAFLGVMTNPFLLDIGFSKLDIAQVVKTFGLIMTLLGSYVGALIALKGNFKKILLFAGILQMITNLIFILQAYLGHNMIALYFTIGIENFAGGIGTIIFTAFISNLCNKSFSATQFALFTSLATVGRNFLSSGSGFVADNYGWYEFFIVSTMLAIPALIILKFINLKEN